MVIPTDDFDKLKETAVRIALNADVSSPRDSAVFFAGSKKNMREAMHFCRENSEDGFMTLLHTEAHQQLSELPLSGRESRFSSEEMFDLNGAASARFAQEASGNVTVFCNKVTGRSTFFTLELPALLLNDEVETINNEDKMLWLRFVQPAVLPQTDIIPPEAVRFDTSSLNTINGDHGNNHQVDDGYTM